MKTTKEPIGPPVGGYAKQMPMGHYVDQEIIEEDWEFDPHNTDMTLCYCFPVYWMGLVFVVVWEIVEIVAFQYSFGKIVSWLSSAKGNSDNKLDKNSELAASNNYEPGTFCYYNPTECA